MAERRIPMHEPPRKRKRAACRLCGTVTILTKTHIPARSAGNVGSARRPVVVVHDDGRQTYDLGNEELGGMWGRWFCAECNNATRSWDEEYTRWTIDPLRALHDPKNPGNTFAARAYTADPGALVRCLWAWMFALADNLRARQPEIAAAVLRGSPAEPSERLRLLLAATRDTHFGMLVLPLAGAIVTAPPFVAVLQPQVVEQA